MTDESLAFRIERDSLGEMSIPAHCYWGLRTARAQEHLFLSGLIGHGRLIEAAVTVRKAVAQINQELGRLDQSIGQAIVQACDEVLSGAWRDQFISEPFQSGADSAFDRNMNEVLANRAEEIMGGKLGEHKLVNPDYHLPVGQSGNEVFGVSMRLAVLSSLKSFEASILDLERLLRRKALESAKSKNTPQAHGIDPGSSSLKLAFNSFGAAMEKSLRRIKDESQLLQELHVNSSNSGVDPGANPEFVSRLADKLAKLSGLKLHISVESGRFVESMSDFLAMSAALKELAIALSKIAYDLRHLMPDAKVAYGGSENAPAPSDYGLSQSSMAESLHAVAFQVIGNDLAIGLALQSEQAQITAIAPMVVNNLLRSIDLLRLAVSSFNRSLLLGKFHACNEWTRLTKQDENHFFALLSEHLGFDKSRQLFEEFSGSAKQISDALGERNMVSAEVLEQISKHNHFERERSGSPDLALSDSGSDEESQTPESE